MIYGYGMHFRSTLSDPAFLPWMSYYKDKYIYNDISNMIFMHFKPALSDLRFLPWVCYHKDDIFMMYIL